MKVPSGKQGGGVGSMRQFVLGAQMLKGSSTSPFVHAPSFLLLGSLLLCAAACDVYKPSLIASGVAGGQAAGGEADDSQSSTTRGGRGTTGGGATGAAGGESGSSGGASGAASSGGSGGGSVVDNFGGGTSDPSSSATGGSTYACPTVAVGGTELVDDMDDNNDFIVPCSGRKGAWFTYDSSSSRISGVVPPVGYVFAMMPVSDAPVVPASSGYAAKLYIENTSYGDCGMGFSLNGFYKSLAAYDLSGYAEISFSYMTKNIVGESLFLQIVLASTASFDDGGTCTSNCNDHYSVELQSSEAGWTRRSFKIQDTAGRTDFAQRGWSQAAVPFTLKDVRKIQFNVLSGKGSINSSLWVDNVVLTRL